MTVRLWHMLGCATVPSVHEPCSRRYRNQCLRRAQQRVFPRKRPENKYRKRCIYRRRPRDKTRYPRCSHRVSKIIGRTFTNKVNDLRRGEDDWKLCYYQSKQDERRGDYEALVTGEDIFSYLFHTLCIANIDAVRTVQLSFSPEKKKA